MNTAPLLSSASVAHASGNFAEANRLCRQVLESEPDNIRAHLLLGIIEAKVGDPELAVQVLEHVKRVDPASFHAPFWRSFALKKLGRNVEAIQDAQTALAQSPHDPQAIANLGLCLMEVRLLERAEQCLSQAISLAPEAVQVRYSLSQCLLMQGRKVEAAEVLECALTSGRLSADSLMNLGRHFLTLNNASGATQCARKALQLAPNSVAAELLLARALLENNNAGEAEEHLKNVISRDHSDSQTYSMLGTAVQALGRIDDAFGYFRKSLEADPSQGYAYFALVNNKRVAESDRAIVEKMSLLAEAPDLPPKQRSYLQYGLGKAHEDLGEYPLAMKAYDEANRVEHQLKFKDRAFNQDQYAESFDNTIKQFSRQFFDRNGNLGSSSEVPVFVVGMMRSGTTLIEQILSCHPDVAPAGELTFWPDNWRGVLDCDQNEPNPIGIRTHSDRYLGLLREICPRSKRIVDKMPGNYAGLGIIHLVFPRAKIIHVRRNPADTCLSIYVTPNRASPAFVHDKGSIAFAYRQYLKVMDHWRKVLPQGTLLDLDYEDLVTDSEQAARRMLEFCGLAWNEACARPQDNKRSVVTPSVWQVRQPVYRTAMERWRKFEPWIGPFKELLDIRDNN